MLASRSVNMMLSASEIATDFRAQAVLFAVNALLTVACK
jgi:hypothetical protein